MFLIQSRQIRINDPINPAKKNVILYKSTFIHIQTSVVTINLGIAEIERWGWLGGLRYDHFSDGSEVKPERN